MDKTGWTKVKLGNIVNIQRGKRLTKKELSEEKNEDTPYKVIHGGIKPLGYYGQYNRKGNVCIVINTGNAGDVHYIDEDFWSSDACYCLYADSSKAINKFIYYQVLANEQYLHSQVRKSAMPTISADPISGLEIYLPDLEIQNQIVKLLSSIDDIIQSKLDESTKYQNMKTQLMNDIFANGERDQNWTKVKLGDIATSYNGKAYKQHELLDSGKYIVLRVGNFFTNDKYYYSDLELDDNKYIDNGDLIYAWSASFGPRIWDGDRCIYHYHIWKVVPHSVDKKYLYYILDRNTEILKQESHGSTMQHLTKENFDSQIIPLPPIEQQTMIANLLTMYDDVIETVNKEKEDYEKIKTQMMNMIFA